MKAHIPIDFLAKDATVNGASYCQLFRKYSPYLLNDPCISKLKNNAIYECESLHLYCWGHEKIKGNIGHFLYIILFDE